MRVTEQLLSINRYSRPGRKLAARLGIIYHFTGIRNQRAGAVYTYFEKDCFRLKRYASAHYCIDINGKIFRFIPDDEVAYHCGTDQIDPGSRKIYTDWARNTFPQFTLSPALTSPNMATLGIELCFTGAQGEFSEATLESAVKLGASLCTRFDIPLENIGTHHMVVGWKECPLYWARQPDKFEIFRTRIAELIGTTSGLSR